MPRPYGIRGGWRAPFAGAVLEYTMRAGFTGQGPATLGGRHYVSPGGVVIFDHRHSADERAAWIAPCHVGLSAAVRR